MSADRLQAEMDLRNLVADLAVHADSGTVEQYVACFTEDAEWHLPANPNIGLEAADLVGHAQIGDGVRHRRGIGLQGPGTGTMHSLATLRFEILGDDDATGIVYYQLIGRRDGKQVLFSAGRYLDRYRRTADGWKLAHRAIVRD